MDTVFLVPKNGLSFEVLEVGENVLAIPELTLARVTNMFLCFITVGDGKHLGVFYSQVFAQRGS